MVMDNTIDKEKLNEAKAKLACHIEPPKSSASSSCSTGPVPAQGGKVRLTEMTTAGG
jgi:hypothetical protein